MSTSVEAPVAPSDGNAHPTRSRVLRFVRLVGAWVAVVPFAAVGLFYAAFGPAVLATQLTEWAVSTEIAVLEIAVVVLLMGLTVGGLVLGFVRGILAVHHRPSEALLWTTVTACFAVGTFASITGLLYLESMLDVDRRISDDEVMDHMIEFYGWHALSTMPMLDLATSLDWDAPFSLTDRRGGMLIVSFKFLVLLPLVLFVQRLFALVGAPASYSQIVRTALRKSGANVTKTDVRHGYEGAILEHDRAGRVLVEAMPQVWTEDAPMRRLRSIELGNDLPSFAVDGYLLVVDAVASSARERIDEAFAEAQLPAKLVAWRADEGPEVLGHELERFAGELPPVTGP